MTKRAISPKSKRSFSYEELMGGKVPRAELEALSNAGMLDEDTLKRLGHIGRFFEQVASSSPNPDLKVSDCLTGDELQKIWRDTADEGFEVGNPPSTN